MYKIELRKIDRRRQWVEKRVSGWRENNGNEHKPSACVRVRWRTEINRTHTHTQSAVSLSITRSTPKWTGNGFPLKPSNLMRSTFVNSATVSCLLFGSINSAYMRARTFQHAWNVVFVSRYGCVSGCLSVIGTSFSVKIFDFFVLVRKCSNKCDMCIIYTDIAHTSKILRIISNVVRLIDECFGPCWMHDFYKFPITE